MKARQDEYLAYATQTYEPGSATNVIAHAEDARRNPSHHFDAAAVTPEAMADSFNRIDTFADTADFDLVYLLNLWYGYRDMLTPTMRKAIEKRMKAFKYWFTDPQPAGFIDQRYYWSENHQLLYHTAEYLAGQAFPTATFKNDGKSGLWHRQRATKFIDAWLTQKAQFGFTEWHSDVYYQKTADALLTIVEWVKDPQIAARASAILDVLLFDIALNLQKGNFGATHGRSYMKDKSVATDQDTFGMAKLLFDDTSEGYNSDSDPGAVLFARARRFQLPSVLRRVAHYTGTSIDRERMGVPLDPEAPIVPNPVAPYGYDFSDKRNVPFWWERGALTAWQEVPITLKTLDKYDLWESDFFKPFKPLVDLVHGDVGQAQALARTLAPMLGFALLTEVNTYTYRTDSVMLSTAQSYRPGTFGEQHHISQATLDENAIVFTTHPKNEPQRGTQWPDDDGYWTGDGSLPRAAQQGALSISIYAPQFAKPGPPLDSFSYLDYTHAYFPKEHFDELVRQDGWTFGRRGNGYVALWSWRPTKWRDYTDPAYFTHGLTEHFDLVAPGGADDVWLTQVGDATTFKSFAAFRGAVLASPPKVTRLPANGELPGGFYVSWRSPTEGKVTFGTHADLKVSGSPVAIDGYARYDNLWSRTPFGSPTVSIADKKGGLTLDLTSGAISPR
jgi:hypothetical protein